MSEYKVAVIPGDGVGIEVTAEAVKVLKAVEEKVNGLSLELTQFDWGSDRLKRIGKMMPEDGIQIASKYDAIFFGAVGDADIQDHITLNGLILPLRRKFDQYICLRPSYLYEGVQSPLAGKSTGDIDFVVIRENVEGEYSDCGGRVYMQMDDEVAVQTAVFTRRGCRRVMKYAFQLARKRDKKKKVTSITKSNAEAYSMVMWDEVFEEVSGDYGDVETETLLVDAACMDLIRRPQDFDVIVASNLFGDILTDIGAIIAGSMGLAPSGNIDPERRFPSMFEPVHGAAFDLVGKGLVNPIAAILSAKMMLEFFGENDGADLIESAVRRNLSEGRIRTVDIGGTSSTQQVGDDITRLISES